MKNQFRTLQANQYIFMQRKTVGIVRFTRIDGKGERRQLVTQPSYQEGKGEDSLRFAAGLISVIMQINVN